MSKNTELQQEEQKEIGERELLIGLTRAVMSMQKQQEQIIELLVELLPKETEESNGEPSLKELMVMQIEQIDELSKYLLVGDGARRESANMAGMYEQELEEVRGLVEEIIDATYPRQGTKDFTVEFLAKRDKKAHGDYSRDTAHIRIFNSFGKPKEHLIATLLHEVAHHVEYVLHGDTGHTERFYDIMHTLFSEAIDRDLIDYFAVRKLKEINSTDIAKMEEYFGAPAA